MKVVSVPLTTSHIRVGAAVIGVIKVLAMLVVDTGRIQATMLIPVD